MNTGKPFRVAVQRYVWQCKSETYRVDANPSQLLMAQLVNGGGHLVQWLTLKIVGGEKRYYFNDDDDKNYIVLYEQAKKVRYKNATGKIWQENIFTN
ncbi:MAG: hypothetical protein ABIU63_10230 [Chitinophagaceae bacterium]